jgi:hypothetical protein
MLEIRPQAIPVHVLVSQLSAAAKAAVTAQSMAEMEHQVVVAHQLAQVDLLQQAILVVQDTLVCMAVVAEATHQQVLQQQLLEAEMAAMELSALSAVPVLRMQPEAAVV